MKCLNILSNGSFSHKFAFIFTDMVCLSKIRRNRLLSIRRRYLVADDSRKQRMLNAALKAGNHTRLEALLKARTGSDKNWLDKALIKAAIRGESECIKVLIAAGASVNCENTRGWTPLMFALRHTEDCVKMHCVKILLGKGANINHLNQKGIPYGITALMLATVWNDIKLVKFLIEKGADANCSNMDGETALTTAVQMGHSKLVEILIKRGANMNHKDEKGMTALMVA